jgi:hypothetical protein
LPGAAIDGGPFGQANPVHTSDCGAAMRRRTPYDSVTI